MTNEEIKTKYNCKCSCCTVTITYIGELSCEVEELKYKNSDYRQKILRLKAALRNINNAVGELDMMRHGDNIKQGISNKAILNLVIEALESNVTATRSDARALRDFYQDPEYEGIDIG